MNDINVVEKFYSAFKNRDYVKMNECYHSDIEFNDPLFHLKGKQVQAMWHMLVSRGNETKINYHVKLDNDGSATCIWIADYPYGPKRRMVHNIVESKLDLHDGKIIRQKDFFDLRKWSTMALGPTGLLLGWSDFFKNKVRKIANESLTNFIQSHKEYL